MAVVVFGSINMDLVVRTPRLPIGGETLAGRTFFTAPGGKGANQAVACARMGAATSMIGRVGDDGFGETLRAGLAADHVDVAGVAVLQGQPSGVAIIAVDDRAENTIIIVPGANGALDTSDLDRLDAALAGANVLLLQLEIPLPIVIAAAKQARQHGVTVILDPAPAQPLPAELYQLVDMITPNESEASVLVDFAVQDTEAAALAALQLCERGAKQVIIKLGSKGVYWFDGTAGDFVPAIPVVAVDTVAAGDAFNGALAAALDQGLPREKALQWAVAAGALSATLAGAQPSLPTRAQVEALLARSIA